MTTLDDKTKYSLRKLNIIAGVFHSALALFVLYFSNSFSLPVTATYLAGPPGSSFTNPVTLFNLRTGYMVALFLALSAFFHFLVASKFYLQKYMAGLKNNINKFRWV